MRRLWILCLLAGCTLEPRFEMPTFELTEGWKTAAAAPQLQYKDWWDAFEDPVLAGLIGKAAEKNQDLIAAEARVEQARDMAKIARARLFPWLNANLGYSNQSQTLQIYGPNLPSYPFVTREHQREYALPLTMNYEVDLWGKIRSAYKSADLRTQAREDAYNWTMLLVATELANAYFQARILDAAIAVYEALIQTRKAQLKIYKDRYQALLIDYTQVAAAQADLDRTESMYGETKQKRAVFENMVAVLMGETPSGFKLEAAPLTAAPPKIPEGVPADILGRRPDLAEMQRLLSAVHAYLGVSYANYFPSLDLEGTLGSSAPLSKFFLKGLSWFWGLGANLSEVLFDGLARYYKLQLNWAEFNEAVAKYRQGILNACQEVENALSNIEWLDKRRELVAHAVEASRTEKRIADNRFRYGVDSLLPETFKQAQTLDDDLSYLTLLGFSYSNTVQLIRALGGGW